MKYRVLLAAMLATVGARVAAENSSADCARLVDDGARLTLLRCLAGRASDHPPAPDQTPTGCQCRPRCRSSIATADDRFHLTRKMDEKAYANKRFDHLHNRNYLLPLTCNSNIDEEAAGHARAQAWTDGGEVSRSASKPIIWEHSAGRTAVGRLPGKLVADLPTPTPRAVPEVDQA